MPWCQHTKAPAARYFQAINARLSASCGLEDRSSSRPKRSMGWLFSLICMLAFAIPQAPAHAAEAHPNRMRVDYVPPTNPAHQALYERLKERRALEKLQEIFSPLRLPVDLTLRTMGCDGVSNAWYGRTDHQVNVCYEYLNEIMQAMPKETTAEGVTPADAVMGQFFYVFAHEMGHAMFDILAVPVFGNAEDAADHFATYIMLQFGKDQSRGLITGAAYSYKKYVRVRKCRHRLRRSLTFTPLPRSASTISSVSPMALIRCCLRTL